MTTTAPITGGITAETGNVRVTATWIGEGYDGEYDETNPADAPLIRFDTYAKVGTVPEHLLDDPEAHDGWSFVNGGSWCTAIDARRDPNYISARTAELVFAIAKADPAEWRRLAENASHWS